jgi:hypothetical protein
VDFYVESTDDWVQAVHLGLDLLAVQGVGRGGCLVVGCLSVQSVQEGRVVDHVYNAPFLASLFADRLL